MLFWVSFICFLGPFKVTVSLIPNTKNKNKISDNLKAVTNMTNNGLPYGLTMLFQIPTGKCKFVQNSFCEMQHHNLSPSDRSYTDTFFVVPVHKMYSPTLFCLSHVPNTRHSLKACSKLGQMWYFHHKRAMKPFCSVIVAKWVHTHIVQELVTWWYFLKNLYVHESF